jgi:hypothetical protein
MTRLSVLERTRCQVPGCHHIAIMKLITPKVKRNKKVIDQLCMFCVKLYLKALKIEEGQ